MLDAYFLFDSSLDRFRARQVAETAQGVRAVPGNFGTISCEQPLGSSIKARIDVGIEAADCLVVLIGENTAADPRVTYAIGRAVHDFDKPVIGIRIHTLADEHGSQGVAGEDPFTHSGLSARSLIQIETYDPPFATSVFARSHIRFSLRDWMELAIRESVRRNTTRDRRATRRSATYG